MNSTDNKSFVRWQGRTIEEFGKIINLLLTLSLATIGFVISKMLDKDFSFRNSSAKFIVCLGTLIALTTVVTLLVLIYNRFKAFKITTQIARSREKNKRDDIVSLRSKATRIDKQTWLLFKVSISFFLLSELLTVLGFTIEVLS